MTFTDGLRIWFLALFGLALVAAIAGIVRFLPRRGEVEKQFGPLPAPPPVVLSILGIAILLTRFGEISANWQILRVLGFALSLYTIVMMPLTVRALGRFGIPGTAVLRDHSLVTSGPYRFVRHPGYSAVLALWLGAALGTLNWILCVLGLLLIAAMTMVSREEERLMREKFGAEYEVYAARTGRFIPKLWGRQ